MLSHVMKLWGGSVLQLPTRGYQISFRRYCHSVLSSYDDDTSTGPKCRIIL